MPDAALVERGRRAYAARAWRDAYAALSEADSADLLAAGELELLATAAAMLGRDAEWTEALERAHYAHLDAGETRRAVRCAFWIGVRLARAGDIGPASGWLARAQRLLDADGGDCVERGYLLLPQLFAQSAQGDYDGAVATAAAAAEVAERFGDDDLLALAAHEQGHLLLRLGRVQEGLVLLDESMVLATGGHLSPYVTGIVYCGTIAACHDVYELRRASEWTEALGRWCDEQPDLIAFTGACLVHRAEVMQLSGAWRDALGELQRACARLLQAENEAAAGQAYYHAGELHRLQGEFAAAEEAYRDASRLGYEPLPGFALLRLAQGRREDAVAAIRRALGERTEALARARLLPAYVEISLAVGDVAEARTACVELEEVAASHGSAMLRAMAGHARGAIELHAGEWGAALAALRPAAQAWLELGAPYEAACARALVAVACRALGDRDAAELELAAAREVFARLGAQPDVAWIDSLLEPGGPGAAHGLTSRELEVLRLVAAGHSNREIAATLVISEHTVARHVQNIFAKLRVSSRTAASAFAFEHALL